MGHCPAETLSAREVVFCVCALSFVYLARLCKKQRDAFTLSPQHTRDVETFAAADPYVYIRVHIYICRQHIVIARILLTNNTPSYGTWSVFDQASRRENRMSLTTSDWQKTSVDTKAGGFQMMPGASKIESDPRRPHGRASFPPVSPLPSASKLVR